MILGLCGAARSGKDTVADFITDIVEDDVLRVQVAGPLKAFLRDLFDWTEEHTDGDLKDVPDERYPRSHNHHLWPGSRATARDIGDDECIDHLTPREAMQKLGGEYAESTFPAIYAVRAARWAAGWAAEPERTAIITDLRFVRDLKALKERGGFVVQVHRDGDGLTGKAASHGSETARDQPEFQALVDYHIHNDGTLNDLLGKVDAMLLSAVNLGSGTADRG
jgi:hypothetical protein